MTFEQAFIDELEKLAEEERTRRYSDALGHQLISQDLGYLGTALGSIPGIATALRRGGISKGTAALTVLGALGGGFGGHVLGRHITREKGEPMRWGRTIAAAPLNIVPFVGPAISANLFKGKIPKEEKSGA